MQHDDAVYLRHMLEMARKVLALTVGKTAGEFEQDETRRLALRHLLQIVGMRHRVVHDHMGIDEEIVWKTVKDDLPERVRLLEGKTAP